MNKAFIKIISLFLTLTIPFLCLACKDQDSLTSSPQKTFCVVIDPGHGGIDGGCSGITTGNKESDINLDIAKRLGEKLRSIGIKVVFTRTTADGLYGTLEPGFKRRDMQKRREIVLSAKPDILISVHMNKFPISTRRGAQVYYQKGDEISHNFAKRMQKTLNTFVNLPQQNRGFESSSGDFWMCKIISPAIIVECGFLSNEKDDALFDTQKYRNEVAYFLFDGIVSYLMTEYSSLP